MNGSGAGGSDWAEPPSTGAHQSHNNTVVYVYPTVHPETIWVPIVCCIVLFPAIVLTVVLLLRHRAMRARARARITRKRDAVRYTHASNKYCKVKLQHYDGLETVQPRIAEERKAASHMNGSYTVSTDLATAIDRSEVTDGDVSAFDLAAIVTCRGRRRGRLPTSYTDDDIASGGSSQE